jgi:Uncharacterized lipoprotein
MKTIKPLSCLCVLLFAQFLTGCAFTKDYVGLNYAIRGGRDKVAGADAVKVEVRVADQREAKDIVGRKINGWGSETAGIISTNDVVELVRGAIGTELEMRGFSRGEGVVVSVELNKFYNRFITGFFAGDSIANLIMNVQVKGRDGAIVFSKNVVAEGLEANIQVAAGHNAKASLEQALAKGVTQLFDDAAFVPALLKAGGRSEANKP